MAEADPATKLADAALKILARKHWDELSLAEVARAAKIPLAKLQSLAPAKSALLGMILNRIGQETARCYRPDKQSQSARERLFDVGMAWFEALAPHKKAVRGLYAGLRRDPLTLVSARGDIVSAAEWLFTLAAADTGSAVTLRALAYAGILARTVPVWLDDDEDLSKTMARLDRDLGQAEHWAARKPRPEA